MNREPRTTSCKPKSDKSVSHSDECNWLFGYNWKGAGITSSDQEIDELNRKVLELKNEAQKLNSIFKYPVYKKEYSVQKHAQDLGVINEDSKENRKPRKRSPYQRPLSLEEEHFNIHTESSNTRKSFPEAPMRQSRKKPAPVPPSVSPSRTSSQETHLEPEKDDRQRQISPKRHRPSIEYPQGVEMHIQVKDLESSEVQSDEVCDNRTTAKHELMEDVECMNNDVKVISSVSPDVKNRRLSLGKKAKAPLPPSLVPVDINKQEVTPEINRDSVISVDKTEDITKLRSNIHDAITSRDLKEVNQVQINGSVGNGIDTHTEEEPPTHVIENMEIPNQMVKDMKTSDVREKKETFVHETKMDDSETDIKSTANVSTNKKYSTIITVGKNLPAEIKQNGDVVMEEVTKKTGTVGVISVEDIRDVIDKSNISMERKNSTTPPNTPDRPPRRKSRKSPERPPRQKRPRSIENSSSTDRSVDLNISESMKDNVKENIADSDGPVDVAITKSVKVGVKNKENIVVSDRPVEIDILESVKVDVNDEENKTGSLDSKVTSGLSDPVQFEKSLTNGDIREADEKLDDGKDIPVKTEPIEMTASTPTNNFDSKGLSSNNADFGAEVAFQQQTNDILIEKEDKDSVLDLSESDQQDVSDFERNQISFSHELDAERHVEECEYREDKIEVDDFKMDVQPLDLNLDLRDLHDILPDGSIRDLEFKTTSALDISDAESDVETNDTNNAIKESTGDVEQTKLPDLHSVDSEIDITDYYNERSVKAKVKEPTLDDISISSATDSEAPDLPDSLPPSTSNTETTSIEGFGPAELSLPVDVDTVHAELVQIQYSSRDNTSQDDNRYSDGMNDSGVSGLDSIYEKDLSRSQSKSFEEGNVDKAKPETMKSSGHDDSAHISDDIENLDSYVHEYKMSIKKSEKPASDKEIAVDSELSDEGQKTRSFCCPDFLLPRGKKDSKKAKRKGKSRSPYRSTTGEQPSDKTGNKKTQKPSKTKVKFFSDKQSKSVPSSPRIELNSDVNSKYSSMPKLSQNEMSYSDSDLSPSLHNAHRQRRLSYGKVNKAPEAPLGLEDELPKRPPRLNRQNSPDRQNQKKQQISEKKMQSENVNDEVVEENKSSREFDVESQTEVETTLKENDIQLKDTRKEICTLKPDIDLAVHDEIDEFDLKLDLGTFDDFEVDSFFDKNVAPEVEASNESGNEDGSFGLNNDTAKNTCDALPHPVQIETEDSLMNNGTVTQDSESLPLSDPITITNSHDELRPVSSDDELRLVSNDDNLRTVSDEYQNEMKHDSNILVTSIPDTKHHYKSYESARSQREDNQNISPSVDNQFIDDSQIKVSQTDNDSSNSDIVTPLAISNIQSDVASDNKAHTFPERLSRSRKKKQRRLLPEIPTHFQASPERIIDKILSRENENVEPTGINKTWKNSQDNLEHTSDINSEEQITQTNINSNLSFKPNTYVSDDSSELGNIQPESGQSFVSSSISVNYSSPKQSHSNECVEKVPVSTSHRHEDCDTDASYHKHQSNQSDSDSDSLLAPLMLSKRKEVSIFKNLLTGKSKRQAILVNESKIQDSKGVGNVKRKKVPSFLSERDEFHPQGVQDVSSSSEEILLSSLTESDQDSVGPDVLENEQETFTKKQMLKLLETSPISSLTESDSLIRDGNSSSNTPTIEIEDEHVDDGIYVPSPWTESEQESFATGTSGTKSGRSTLSQQNSEDLSPVESFHTADSDYNDNYQSGQQDIVNTVISAPHHNRTPDRFIMSYSDSDTDSIGPEIRKVTTDVVAQSNEHTLHVENQSPECKVSSQEEEEYPESVSDDLCSEVIGELRRRSISEEGESVLTGEILSDLTESKVRHEYQNKSVTKSALPPTRKSLATDSEHSHQILSDPFSVNNRPIEKVAHQKVFTSFVESDDETFSEKQNVLSETDSNRWYVDQSNSSSVKHDNSTIQTALSDEYMSSDNESDIIIDHQIDIDKVHGNSHKVLSNLDTSSENESDGSFIGHEFDGKFIDYQLDIEDKVHDISQKVFSDPDVSSENESDGSFIDHQLDTKDKVADNSQKVFSDPDVSSENESDDSFIDHQHDTKDKVHDSSQKVFSDPDVSSENESDGSFIDHQHDTKDKVHDSSQKVLPDPDVSSENESDDSFIDHQHDTKDKVHDSSQKVLPDPDVSSENESDDSFIDHQHDTKDKVHDISQKVLPDPDVSSENESDDSFFDHQHDTKDKVHDISQKVLPDPDVSSENESDDSFIDQQHDTKDKVHDSSQKVLPDPDVSSENESDDSFIDHQHDTKDKVHDISQKVFFDPDVSSENESDGSVIDHQLDTKDKVHVSSQKVFSDPDVSSENESDGSVIDHEWDTKDKVHDNSRNVLFDPDVSSENESDSRFIDHQRDTMDKVHDIRQKVLSDPCISSENESDDSFIDHQLDTKDNVSSKSVIDHQIDIEKKKVHQDSLLSTEIISPQNMPLENISQSRIIEIATQRKEMFSKNKNYSNTVGQSDMVKYVCDPTFNEFKEVRSQHVSDKHTYTGLDKASSHRQSATSEAKLDGNSCNYELHAREDIRHQNSQSKKIQSVPPQLSMSSESDSDDSFIDHGMDTHKDNTHYDTSDRQKVFDGSSVDHRVKSSLGVHSVEYTRKNIELESKFPDTENEHYSEKDTDIRGTDKYKVHSDKQLHSSDVDLNRSITDDGVGINTVSAVNKSHEYLLEEHTDTESESSLIDHENLSKSHDVAVEASQQQKLSAGVKVTNVLNKEEENHAIPIYSSDSKLIEKDFIKTQNEYCVSPCVDSDHASIGLDSDHDSIGPEIAISNVSASVLDDILKDQEDQVSSSPCSSSEFDDIYQDAQEPDNVTSQVTVKSGVSNERRAEGSNVISGISRSDDIVFDNQDDNSIRTNRQEHTDNVPGIPAHPPPSLSLSIPRMSISGKGSTESDSHRMEARDEVTATFKKSVETISSSQPLVDDRKEIDYNESVETEEDERIFSYDTSYTDKTKELYTSMEHYKEDEGFIMSNYSQQSPRRLPELPTSPKDNQEIIQKAKQFANYTAPKPKTDEELAAIKLERQRKMVLRQSKFVGKGSDSDSYDSEEERKNSRPNPFLSFVKDFPSPVRKKKLGPGSFSDDTKLQKSPTYSPERELPPRYSLTHDSRTQSAFTKRQSLPEQELLRTYALSQELTPKQSLFIKQQSLEGGQFSDEQKAIPTKPVDSSKYHHDEVKHSYTQESKPSQSGHIETKSKHLETQASEQYSKYRKLPDVFTQDLKSTPEHTKPYEVESLSQQRVESLQSTPTYTYERKHASYTSSIPDGPSQSVTPPTSSPRHRKLPDITATKRDTEEMMSKAKQFAELTASRPKTKEEMEIIRLDKKRKMVLHRSRPQGNLQDSDDDEEYSSSDSEKNIFEDNVLSSFAHTDQTAVDWSKVSNIISEEKTNTDDQDVCIVDTKSISDLASTKEHWESKLKVKPSHDEFIVNKPLRQEKRWSISDNTQDYSTMADVDPYANESALEREIRLANEREQMLKAEQEERAVLQAKLAGKVSINKSFTSSNNNSNKPQSIDTKLTFREMTEADRGSEILKRESIIKQEIEDHEKREDALKQDTLHRTYDNGHISNSHSEEEDEHTESFIEMEIRLQREREDDLEKQRHHKYDISMPVETVTQKSIISPIHSPKIMEETVVEREQTESASDASSPIRELSYEDTISKVDLESESIIARELREAREREEEYLRMHGKQNQQIKRDTSPAVRAPAVQTAKHDANHNIIAKQGTWQKDVSPYKKSNDRRGSMDSLSSSHSTGRSGSDIMIPSKPVKVQPIREDNDNERCHRFQPNNETPIQREIRLNRERENQYRSDKGLPLLVVEEETPVESRTAAEPSLDSRVFRSQPTSDGTLKKLSTSRLQQELKREKEKELALREQGIIKTTSEDHISDLMKYNEISPANDSQPVKRNFVMRKSVSTSFVESNKGDKLKEDSTPDRKTQLHQDSQSKSSPGDPLKRRSVTAAFSYRESRNSAETKIERELREMREREEELKKQRTVANESS